MNNFLYKLFRNSSVLLKILLFLSSVIAIVYMFPKEGKFKYNYTKGKPWQYETLYAPFDFAVQKPQYEVDLEKIAIQKNTKQYFVFNVKKVEQINALFNKKSQDNNLTKKQISLGKNIISKVYKFGFLDEEREVKTELIKLRKTNEVEDIPFYKLLTSKKVFDLITKKTEGDYVLLNILSDILKPNVTFDENLTQKFLNERLNDISYTKGKVSNGELIILKGDIVEGKKLNVLKSFEQESKSKIWSESNYNWIVFGYTILVALALLMLMLFLQRYRPEIFEDNNKVVFIFVNVFLFFLVQTLVVKYTPDYTYVVPLTILPIILKTFFDARLGFFTHVLTVVLLSFVVPNGLEFIFLHIIAGIVTILSVSELYKRAGLFISITQITLVYMITYFAFSIIKEGNADGLNLRYFLMFTANGLLSFLAGFFIYFYEKLFGLVSDVMLLELSNTNSKLLRELNEKAPGTFQHSMQVANLAEAAANEIGANSMLVRTGALYHDIGKMKKPKYFTENQSTGVNPHNELPPKESAKIIIDHILNGIEIAKHHNLPDRIIDFIRTHHGTSLVYYFYKKETANNPDKKVEITDFKYKGPIPFSKETAILMMCDAAEAASKSLKNPTSQTVSDLIDKVIEKQQSENQFINSDITFRDIKKIKKVIKNKLMNIYHLRIEYPE